MFGEVYFLTETFPTFRARVRLLPGVDSVVPREVLLMIKALVAFRALVWLLPGVNPFVRTEDDFVTKVFPADQAGTLLPTCVNELVIPEPRAPTKNLPTLKTLVRFWLLEHGSMSSEIRSWVVAFQKGENFLFRMSSIMLHEQDFLSEALFAF